MNLKNPLQLAGAKTVGVSLVPTTSHFKPVIVVDAPIDREQGKRLGQEHLWTKEGAVRLFEGRHGVKGELASAFVTFDGKKEIKVQKVCKVKLYVDKDEMRVALRIHLPDSEGDDETVEDAELLEVLRFLRTLNKSGYELTIEDAQGRLALDGDKRVDMTGPTKSLDANEDTSLLAKDPQATWEYDDKMIKLAFGLVTVEGGWVPWWEVIVKAKSGMKMAGEQPRHDSTVYGSEEQARETAIMAVLAVLQADTTIADLETREVKKLNPATSFLQERRIHRAAAPAETSVN